jgi:hypothetical protein
MGILAVTIMDSELVMKINCSGTRVVSIIDHRSQGLQNYFRLEDMESCEF